MRSLIDVDRRSRIDWGRVARCLACGVEIYDGWNERYRYVDGCRTCSDRRSKHRQRGLVDR